MSDRTNASKRRDYIWNTLGVFLQSAISPLLLIVVTRLNGIDDSGVFSFAMAVAVVFWTISMWGGRTYQVSDTLNKFSNASYVGLRILTSTVLILIAIAFCLTNGYDTEKSAVIISLVCMKLMESIADPFYGVMQSRGYLFRSGVSLVLKFILGVILFTVINVYFEDMVLASASLVLSQVLVFAIYDLPFTPKSRFDFSVMTQGWYFQDVFKIMKITTPVFLGLLFVSLSLNIPRYILDIYHESQSGYFGIMAMPITVLFLFAAFIIQPNVVGLAEDYAGAKYNSFKRTVSKIFQFTAVVGLLAIILTYLIGPQVMGVIFGVDLSDYRLTFTLLVIGAMFNVAVSLFVNIFTVMRSYTKAIIALLWTTLIGVVLSLSIIPQLALPGTSIVFLLLSLAQALIMFMVYRRIISSSSIHAKINT